MTSPSRRCTGPLRLGVPDELRPTLASDDRVVWLGRTAALTPIEQLPWWSSDFFAASAIPGSNDVYYCDWDASAQWGVGEVEASAPWAEPAANMLWVAEVPADRVPEADAAVSALAGRLSCNASPTPLLGELDAVEEHFALPLTVLEPVRHRFDPRGAWEELVRAGLAHDGDPEGPSLVGPGHPVELDELWQMYSDTMRALSSDHPIEAALQREEFDSFVTSDRDAMLVLCRGGAPVSVALSATNLDADEWIDSRWTSQLLQGSGSRDVILVPGIATRIDRRMTGSIVELLVALGRIVVQASANLLLLFPCNNVSRHYTPAIAQKATDRFGEQLTGQVHKAASYIIRGYRVAARA